MAGVEKSPINLFLRKVLCSTSVRVWEEKSWVSNYRQSRVGLRDLDPKTDILGLHLGFFIH